eukprot:5725187-Pyramimonas_sp.AAC.1
MYVPTNAATTTPDTIATPTATATTSPNAVTTDRVATPRNPRRPHRAVRDRTALGHRRPRLPETSSDR